MDEMIEQVAPVHVTLDDLEDLIGALSLEELEELAECDPDDSSMPPSMRCAYKCKKEATEWKGEENRMKLQEGLKAAALAEPDKPEKVFKKTFFSPFSHFERNPFFLDACVNAG